MAAQAERLIVFSGIDGSGKSSHLRWVTNALTLRGEPYRYVRLRWAALASIPLIGTARLLGYSQRHFNPRSQTIVVEQRYHEWAPMRIAWPPLFTLDMAIAAWRKVLRPLQRGEWVICDRYVLDAIVDLAATLRDESLIDRFPGHQLLRLLPDGARTLVLDTDPDTAFARKLDVLDRAYLVERHRLFHAIAAQTGTPIVDGNRPFAVIQEDIAAVIGIDPLPADRGLIPVGVG